MSSLWIIGNPKNVQMLIRMMATDLNRPDNVSLVEAAGLAMLLLYILTFDNGLTNASYDTKKRFF